jgi:hypothetical protein
VAATVQRSTSLLPLLQVYWTQEVVEAISSGGSRGLARYADKCTAQLNKIVNLVRGQLSSLERSTCGALVVIDVHARDVVACTLLPAPAPAPRRFVARALPPQSMPATVPHLV